MTQQTVPLFGSGNKARSKFVSAQRRLNCYVEQPSDQDKMQIVSYYSKPLAVYGRPGLKPYPITRNQVNGGTPQNGPWRGVIRGVYQSSLNAVELLSRTEAMAFVEGNQFWLYTTTTQEAFGYNNGDPTAGKPLMVTNQGSVQFADNGDHFLAVDGAAGYVLNYNLNAAAPSNGPGIITAAAFPQGPTSCAFLAGRFIVNDGMNPGRFWWSDLYDGSSWPGLNFATAESNPDPLNVVFESGGNLYLIGTSTTEFWAPQSTGNAFARVGGSGIDWGSTARDTVRKYQGMVVLLASPLRGARQVIAIQGYTPQVISTPDVENAINADPNPDGATAVVTTINGHAFYVLNLTNTSWAFNGLTWDEWGTEGSRWAGNFIVPSFNGGQFVTDYRNDSLYTIEPNYLLDGTAPISREVITHHLLNNYDRLTINKLTVDAEVGSNGVITTYSPLSARVDGASGAGRGGTGSASAFDTGNTFSVQCWFLTTQTTAQVLVFKATAGNEWECSLEGDGTIDFILSDVATYSTPYTTVNAWTKFTATYNATTKIVRLYLNGALVKTQTGVTSTAGSGVGTATYIGTNTGTVLTGHIDDVQVWNRELSATEIAANLYTQYSANTPGLVALYNSFTNDGTLTFTNQGSNGGSVTFNSGTLFETRTNQTYQGVPRPAQMMLQISRDNGNTWGNEQWQQMGQLGEYKTRTCWRRLGRARDFMFKLRVTDPVPIAFTGGAISAQ